MKHTFLFQLFIVGLAYIAAIVGLCYWAVETSPLTVGYWLCGSWVTLFGFISIREVRAYRRVLRAREAGDLEE